MEWNVILGLSVISALVSTTGTLIALFLKEQVFARSFEDWKATRSLEVVYRKYKDPILFSAIELFNTLKQILEDKDYPPDFLKSKYLASGNETPNRTSAIDVHYNKYKLQSSVYRLCTLLGWIELYRQDIVFLKNDKKTVDRNFEKAISAISNDLANGELNKADDWDKWRDALIYREEQRAIGESMITVGANGRIVLGYAEFSHLFNTDSSTGKSRWIDGAIQFFVDQKPSKDVRHNRLKRLIVHVVNLIEILDEPQLTEKHREIRAKYESVVNDAA